MRTTFLSALLVASIAAVSMSAAAAPVTYVIDPNHTFPSFEADHFGGLSLWRGKFNSSSGKIMLDKEAQTGSLEIEIDAASVDFGHEKINAHVRSSDMLHVEKFPTATYVGTLKDFKDGAPTAVEGTLTLHGVSKPVALKIDRFKCMKHPMSGKEVCGANATGQFQRDDFGVSYGKDHGFYMDMTVQIQVEAVRQE